MVAWGRIFSSFLHLSFHPQLNSLKVRCEGFRKEQASQAL
jgi:hypothetical protein